MLFVHNATFHSNCHGDVDMTMCHLIEEVEIKPRREEDGGPSKSSGEKNIETETERDEVPIEVE